MGSLLFSLQSTLHFSKLSRDSTYVSLPWASHANAVSLLLCLPRGASVYADPALLRFALTLGHTWKLLVGCFCRTLFSLLGCRVLMTGVVWCIPLRHKLSLNKSDSVFLTLALKSCVPAQHTEHRHWPSTIFQGTWPVHRSLHAKLHWVNNYVQKIKFQSSLGL